MTDASWELKSIRQALDELDAELRQLARTRPYDYRREQEILPRCHKLEARRRALNMGAG